MDIVVRPCVAGDETMLSLVGGATFFETYAGFVHGGDIVAGVRNWHKPEVYRAWLDDPDADILIAEIQPGGVAVGYVVLLPRDRAGGGPFGREIKRIYLLHRFHGTGVGKRLMTAAIEAARQRQATALCLDVAEFNDHAIHFYTRFGFGIARSGQITGPDHTYPVHTLVVELAPVSGGV